MDMKQPFPKLWLGQINKTRGEEEEEGKSNWQMTNAKQEATWWKIMMRFKHRKSQLEDNVCMWVCWQQDMEVMMCSLSYTRARTQTSCLHVSRSRICLLFHVQNQSHPRRNKRHRLDPKAFRQHFQLLLAFILRLLPLSLLLFLNLYHYQ